MEKKLLDKAIKAAQGGAKNKFLPAENERGAYHVILDKGGYSSVTGEKVFKPYRTTFTIRGYQRQLKHNHLGYKFTVIWNPEAYEKALTSGKVNEDQE